MKHLAIMNKSTAEAVLSGQKTIETRFSKHKIPPFGVISAQDLVYIKVAGEEIIGQFRVKKVFSFEQLNTTDVDKIFADFGGGIFAGMDDKSMEDYQKLKRESRFGTLIFITESERLITAPIKFKKSDQRGWVVLK